LRDRLHGNLHGVNEILEKSNFHPKFRNYLGYYKKNIFMQATYMFACVNYCINLFKDNTIK